MYTKTRDHTLGGPAPAGVRRDADSAFPPADPLNVDWQTIKTG